MRLNLFRKYISANNKDRKQSNFEPNWVPFFDSSLFLSCVSIKRIFIFIKSPYVDGVSLQSEATSHQNEKRHVQLLFNAQDAEVKKSNNNKKIEMPTVDINPTERRLNTAWSLVKINNVYKATRIWNTIYEYISKKTRKNGKNHQWTRSIWSINEFMKYAQQ